MNTPSGPSEDNIRAAYVSHLISRFKLDNNVFARGDILTILEPIKTSQFQEFSLRLSQGDFPYLDAYQRIERVARSFQSDYEHGIFADVDKMASLFYEKFRALYNITLEPGIDHKQKFVTINLQTVTADGAPMFSAMELEIARRITPERIYDMVTFDLTMFKARVTSEMKTYILEQKRNERMAAITDRKVKAATVYSATPSKHPDFEDAEVID